MKSAEIRSSFLNYFEKKSHKIIKSSPLIPASDPTLLFTNAGMVQFKNYFLNTLESPFKRATTSQKCVRAGGKHNDLENVGFTIRHHTFFEMLGNFSFGDYFKKEAIKYAWELLTELYNLPKNRLRITVFESDDEAFHLWHEEGLPIEWIYRLGEKDNFWAMGDTGPCGPCSEIHYDLGPEHGCKRKECSPACDCGRFLEIWNLVFMQFEKTNSQELKPLKSPCIDTGAGLERLSAVLQNVYSNYDTDLFKPIIEKISKISSIQYGQNNNSDISIRVIADHIRSGVFLIADGIAPSNEARGYVLRRILRRAIRHGKKLGLEKPFLYKIAPIVIEMMGNFYPELNANEKVIIEYLKEEEEKFGKTLTRGLTLLDASIKEAKLKKHDFLSSEVAFKLYDTFGFPVDLTEVICLENGLKLDKSKFDMLMEEQRSKSSWSFKETSNAITKIETVIKNENFKNVFKGYEKLSLSSKIAFLFDSDGKKVLSVKAPNIGYAVFHETPFYPESGGQVGDIGKISQTDTLAHVIDTFKIGQTIVSKFELKSGSLESLSSSYFLEVDSFTRKKTMKNHTATHLLHAALRQILGEKVRQAGSLVSSEKLRFDFTFPRALSKTEKSEIERIVNLNISSSYKVIVKETSLESALKEGALAFFEEKYGDIVRLVTIGMEKTISSELCGGTHVNNTSEIGCFKIVFESSVASGIRRVEALTSFNAIDFLLSRNESLEECSKMLGVGAYEITTKLNDILKKLKSTSKELDNYKLKFLNFSKTDKSEPNDIFKRAKNINGIKIISEILNNTETKILRTLSDQYRDKLGKNSMVFLITSNEKKFFMCLAVSKDLANRFNAGEILRNISKEFGGSGGGKSEFAEGGGHLNTDITKIIESFEKKISNVANGHTG